MDKEMLEEIKKITKETTKLHFKKVVLPTVVLSLVVIASVVALARILPKTHIFQDFCDVVEREIYPEQDQKNTENQETVSENVNIEPESEQDFSYIENQKV